LQILQAASPSKPRFAFRRKGGPSSSKPVTPDPKLDSAQITKHDLASSTDAASISGKTGSYVTGATLPSLTTDKSSDLTIVDLDFCFVDLRQAIDDGNVQSAVSISAVHVRNVRNSIIFLPKLQGSILIYDMKNCVLAVECQQVDILLNYYKLTDCGRSFECTRPHP
jgi:tubulin-specific chaperone C